MSEDPTPEAPPPSDLQLLRAEMRAGFQSVSKRFDEVDKQLGAVDTHLGKHDSRFVSLETRITESEAATRRHFDVAAEGLRADMKVVIDKTTATGQKLDRLITRNAIEHAAILNAITDHGVRITTLEGAAGASTPPST